MYLIKNLVCKFSLKLPKIKNYKTIRLCKSFYLHIIVLGYISGRKHKKFN